VSEPSPADNRAYYDAFSEQYDRDRAGGYHALIDDQAAEIVRRVGVDRDVLEVGCGTGLVLQRVAQFARAATGVDLSPGMLERARARGLQVREGSATELPFDDGSFDVVYSFKVLAHVPEIERSLAEMVRVARPGGHVVFDAYNRRSLRYLTKRLFDPRATSERFDESAISTRFETPEQALAHLPANTRVVSRAGIRVLTPHAAVLRVPGLRWLVERAEWRAMDSVLWRFGGFVVFTVEKQG
jgi:ubiquinone/menaquinone biosynthesis C-methylase UbiE